MSMLAERKRKQKWSLNPRGKLWSDDSNKFGQKMLEKMGWSQGKGLGLNENGITEGIKVTYKNDSKGMGFKDRNDQWTEHEDKYSKLLENLNGSGSTDKNISETKLHSLEKLSQSSRARVHYHKFTRGKDLSRYSEKDLANIFGKKSLKEEPKPEENESGSDKCEEGTKNTWSHNSGSMYDYFKKKLPNFGKNSDYSIGHNGVLQKTEESESENETRVGFGFGLGYNKSLQKEDESSNEFTNKTSFVSYVNSDISSEIPDKEKKKSKRKTENNVDCQVEKSEKKKKKKGRNREENINEVTGFTNNGFDPLFIDVKVNKHTLNTIEEESNEIDENVKEESLNNIDVQENGVDLVNVEKIHKKKKKKDKENKIKENCEMSHENIGEILTSNKKKNKKKSISEGFINIACDTNPNEFLNEKSEKRKSKSCEVIQEIIVEAKNTELEEAPNRKRKINGIDNPNFTDQFTDELTPKKKKRKGLENPVFDLNDSKIDSDLEIVENPYEVKLENKKKKKKSKNIALDNPSFQDSNDSNLDFPEVNGIQENPYEVKVETVKKKKKNKSLNLDSSTPQNLDDSCLKEANAYKIKVDKEKKKKKSKTALDNASFNDSVATCESNNEYEVKRKSKTNKKDKENAGLDNPGLNLSDSLNESEIQCDLMLNVISTSVTNQNSETITNTPSSCLSSSMRLHSAIKRRKSVRFNDVTQERIIPNNVDLQDIENRNELYNINSEVISKSLEDEKMRSDSVDNFDMSSIDKVSFYETKGLDNKAFDQRSNEIEENVASMAQTIEKYQAEVENDINEAKLAAFDISIGEVGNPDGENEKLPNGTKLKFKYANFGAIPHYLQSTVGAKKSYKHLIKGDIVLGFKNTNLHEIAGYASTKYKN